MQDSANGTQVPDLGPKFYIARPRLVRGRTFGSGAFITKTGEGQLLSGATFTPLHCDLADAVNYSCSGEAATWHIFHRDDRVGKPLLPLPFQHSEHFIYTLTPLFCLSCGPCFQGWSTCHVTVSTLVYPVPFPWV